MTTVQFRQPLRIPADHPALAGHFPGYPVIPGVVLLDHVAAALEQWRGQRITRIMQAKFLRPLLPEQPAELTLSEDGSVIRFGIEHDGLVIAGGSIGLAP